MPMSGVWNANMQIEVLTMHPRIVGKTGCPAPLIAQELTKLFRHPLVVFVPTRICPNKGGSWCMDER
jgi:hypothetical protein